MIIFILDTPILCDEQGRNYTCGYIVGSHKNYYPIVPYQSEMMCGHHSIKQFQNLTVNFRSFWWNSTDDFYNNIMHTGIPTVYTQSSPLDEICYVYKN